jgi:PAS domain S-box-containing protein
LAQGQQISHTASWAWKVATEPLYWSEEHFRIFGLDPEIDQPSSSLFMERVHPEDRAPFKELLSRAVREKSDFEHEYRIVLPDGSIKFLRTLGQPRVSSSGELEYIGTVMDITERQRAEEAWQKAQAELAHVSRVTTMGEFAASIAHEVKQPLVGVVINASAGLRWLARDSPDLAEANKAFSAILRDGNRAGDVLSRMRSLFKKACISKERFNMNEAIEEVVTLTQAEARRKKVGILTELDVNLPAVTGDRVHLQQVVMNLILNAIEAMSGVEDRGRDLVIRTQPSEGGRVQVAVQDSGIGLDPPNGERIFDAFYTTKPGGLGMGLSISRSIVETHGGRLWATANDGPGATFQFTL